MKFILFFITIFTVGLLGASNSSLTPGNKSGYPAPSPGGYDPKAYSEQKSSHKSEENGGVDTGTIPDGYPGSGTSESHPSEYNPGAKKDI